MNLRRLVVWFAVACVFASAAPASAEIEKFVDPNCNDQQMCFYWWPKLPALSGWHREEGASRENTSNILVPEGATFAEAETIMYARAIYKPRYEEVKSIADFMAKDRGDTAASLPGTVIAEAPALTNGDGKSIKTQTFFPPTEGEGSWERLAYDEEGDFYLLFTMSAKSKAGLDAAMKDFERLIAGYKAKP